MSQPAVPRRAGRDANALAAGPFSTALLDSKVRAKRHKLNVALIAMPFASVQYPNIQIGLLSAILRQKGFRADTLHLNLEFAARIGAEPFEQLATFRGPLFGDWLFSAEAFETDPDPGRTLPHRYADLARTMFEGRDDAAEILTRIRDEKVGAYLDALIADIRWRDYNVIGFTSTFQQTVASIALARRLKARWPHLVTVFGGANFDGEMGAELVRTVPSIDHAVTGEADAALPALLDALVSGEARPKVPGLLSRDEDGTVRSGGTGPLYAGLRDNPVPDYGEYFERIERLGLLDDPARRLIDLPFESSRGCWWGEKHHCTFCGLNGQSMQFRSKPIVQVADELAELARRHRSFRFIAVDNIIDHRYIDEISMLLSERLVGVDLFYEIKANLSRRQIEGLAQAGVTRIQPGIESLSTPILKLMRKGISGIQNVATLKWAHHYGLRASWNVLWGFPGEAAEEYALQAELVRSLWHIPPPSTWGRVWLERFSPLFYDEASFPRDRVAPHGSYALVYPDHISLDRIAYFFEADLDGALPDETYAELGDRLAAWVGRWKSQERPTLRYWWAPGTVVIEDTRHEDSQGSFVLEGPMADAYHMASDRALSLARLALDTKQSEDKLRPLLDDLVDARLVMREGDLFLSLALPAKPSLGQAALR